MPPTFQQILGLLPHEKTIVATNDVGGAFWPPETAVKYLATGFLNACTGIVIISPLAGILAHIAPLPPGSTRESLARNPNAAVQNAQNLLRNVAQLYNANRAKFSSTQTIVVAGIFDNSPAMGQVIHVINAFFANLGLPIIWQSYPVLNADTRRPFGYSSIIIHAATRGATPIVYLNSVRIN